MQFPDTSLKSYANEVKSGFEDTLTMTILEDTKKTFEFKVTECITAETYLHSKAGDIGFAYHCHADYAWIRGFNKNIKLIRDKTLMQGHDCCNHRYIMQK